jgi:hypothetical protein
VEEHNSTRAKKEQSLFSKNPHPRTHTTTDVLRILSAFFHYENQIQSDAETETERERGSEYKKKDGAICGHIRGQSRENTNFSSFWKMLKFEEKQE